MTNIIGTGFNLNLGEAIHLCPFWGYVMNLITDKDRFHSCRHVLRNSHRLWMKDLLAHMNIMFIKVMKKCHACTRNCNRLI